MPNRILKETICTSDEIDALSPDVEVFFYRIMVVCDDFGLMDARPAILKARCYPLKSIDIKRIQSQLDALVSSGLISLYFVDGKPYLHISNWEKHQQIRAKRAKYPLPDEDQKSSDINCYQMQANAPVIQSNPIQSESNPIQSTQQSKTAFNPKEALLALWVDEQVINDWIELRKQKKAKVTLTAIQGIQNEAIRAGISLEDALRICCQNGWQGFKADWIKEKSNGSIHDQRQNFIDELTGRTRASPERVINGYAVQVD